MVEMVVVWSLSRVQPLQSYRLQSLPGSSVHGVLQARMLEWVAISFSRRSSQPRNWTQVSCIAGRFFTDWAKREAWSGWEVENPLPIQGTQVQSLLQEDCTWHRATKPMHHNCWASTLRARALHQEKPLKQEACTPQWRGVPACRNWRKPTRSNEDPVQPKLKINLKKEPLECTEVIDTWDLGHTGM